MQHLIGFTLTALFWGCAVFCAVAPALSGVPSGDTVYLGAFAGFALFGVFAALSSLLMD